MINLPYINPLLNLSEKTAIVGSSGSLLNSEYGSIINQHDDVIRFNRAPVAHYKKYVGANTTIRVANNHVFINQPLGPAFTNQPPNFIKDLRNSRILFIGPHMIKLEDKEKFTHASNELFMFDYRNIGGLRKRSGFAGPNNPSVGFVSICLCIVAGIKPSLFGFDIDESDQTRSHYWEARSGAGPCHKVSYEKEFLKLLIEKEKVDYYK